MNKDDDDDDDDDDDYNYNYFIIVIIIIIIIIIIVRSAFFDVRVYRPSADSYRDLTPKQIYKKHENEKKRQYAERVMEIEQGTFTPLVFTTTGGMVDECVKCHNRLAVLIPNKKGQSYSSAISWIRAKISVAKQLFAYCPVPAEQTLERASKRAFQPRGHYQRLTESVSASEGKRD